MSSSFGDLPKYPGAAAADRERQLEELRRAPEPQDTAADRLRHAFPALVMFTGIAVALFLVVGMVILLVVRGIETGWLVPVLMAVEFLSLPAVAIGAAFYQRAKMRSGRPD